MKIGVLGTGSVEEPEEIERIGALDKGLLMHGVFRSYLEEQRTSPATGNAQLKRSIVRRRERRWDSIAEEPAPRRRYPRLTGTG